MARKSGERKGEKKAKQEMAEVVLKKAEEEAEEGHSARKKMSRDDQFADAVLDGERRRKPRD